MRIAPCSKASASASIALDLLAAVVWNDITGSRCARRTVAEPERIAAGVASVLLCTVAETVGVRIVTPTPATSATSKASMTISPAAFGSKLAGVKELVGVM